MTSLLRPMSRVRTQARRVPLPLALLLAVALLLSLSWGLATAPLQGPDESEHVGYVEHLAETGRLPSSTTGTGGAYAGDESAALQQGGLLRLVQNRGVRPLWSPGAEQRFRAVEDALPPDARTTGAGPTPVGVNPPLYYAFEAIGWRLTPGAGFFGKLYVLRLGSTMIFLLLVGLTWLLAGEVFGGRVVPRTVATGVVALLPMAGFMSGIVNTDIMLAAWYAAFLWLAVRTARLGLTWKRSALLSLTVALAVLTHGRGLALVPALAVALAAAWLRHRQGLWETARNAAAAAGTLLAGLLVYRLAASTAGGGGALYGGEASLNNQSSAFNIRQLLSSIWQFYLPKLDAMAPRLGPPIGYRQIFVQQYFAGVFSSFEVYFPYWVYDLVQVSVGVLVLVLYSAGLVRWRRAAAHWPAIVILTATAGCLLLFLHVASYRALLGGDNPLIVGRYLLPMTAITGVAAGAIVAALPRRVGVVVGALLLTGLLALSLGALGLNVQRFYA